MKLAADEAQLAVVDEPKLEAHLAVVHFPVEEETPRAGLVDSEAVTYNGETSSAN